MLLCNGCNMWMDLLLCQTVFGNSLLLGWVKARELSKANTLTTHIHASIHDPPPHDATNDLMHYPLCTGVSVWVPASLLTLTPLFLVG